MVTDPDVIAQLDRRGLGSTLNAIVETMPIWIGNVRTVGEHAAIPQHDVVAGADEIQVHLNDRRVFDAEIIGLDEPSDLALLKVNSNFFRAISRINVI